MNDVMMFEQNSQSIEHEIEINLEELDCQFSFSEPR